MGQLEELTGNDFLFLEGIKDIASLREKLHELYPELSKKKYFIAIDRKLVSENIPLLKSHEIALMPPFSGG